MEVWYLVLGRALLSHDFCHTGLDARSRTVGQSSPGIERGSALTDGISGGGLGD